MRLAIGIVVVGSLAAACSSVVSLGTVPEGGGPDGPDGSSPLGVEVEAGSDAPSPFSLRTGLARIACKQLYECPLPESSGDYVRVLFSSESDCVENIPLLWLPYHTHWQRLDHLDHLEPLVAAGRVNIDPAKLEACARVMGEECRSLEFWSDVCDQAFIGTVDEGGACHVNEECRSGFCRAQANTCPGVCVRKGKTGEWCSEYAGCEDGTHCDTQDSRCVLGPPPVSWSTPSVRVGLDETCNIHSSVSPGPRRLCGKDLYCQRVDVVGEGKCRPLLAANAPCRSVYLDTCVAGHLCRGPEGARICQPVNVGEAGDDCSVLDTDSAYRPCDPWKGLACLFDEEKGAMKCMPAGKDGQQRLQVDVWNCAEGYTQVGKFCEPVREAGAPCEVDDDCKSGSCTPAKQCADAYCKCTVGDGVCR